MTCTGLVRNFGSLMAVRILLGIFECVPPSSDEQESVTDVLQGRLPTWCDLPVLILVHAQRPGDTNLLLLLRQRVVRRIFWTSVRPLVPTGEAFSAETRRSDVEIDD